MGFAVYVEVSAAHASRVRCEKRSFEEPVRIALHQVAVLEDAGLTLLAVDDEIARPAGGAARAFPLHRRYEVRSAAPAQTRALHRLDDGLRPAVLECPG